MDRIEPKLLPVASDALQALEEAFVPLSVLADALDASGSEGIAPPRVAGLIANVEACGAALDRARNALESEVVGCALGVEPSVADGLRVMVVDDEDPVRRVLCRILEGHVEHIETFESAAAARDHILEAPFPYDVVITDLRMPGEFDGYAFVSWIAETKPAAVRRVVVMSGDQANHAFQSIGDEAGVTVLAKPFETPDLLRAVVAA